MSHTVDTLLIVDQINSKRFVLLSYEIVIHLRSNYGCILEMINN
jgi:hypothetical protein